MAGLDAGQIENAVDDAEQMLAALADQSRIILAFRGIEREIGLVRQHLGEADDGVQRRAQLVAHGGEEAALGVVGALGLGARALQRMLVVLAARNVARHGDHLRPAPGAIGAL